MPVYLVKSPAGERLVKASTRSVAVNHVIRDTVEAEALSTDDLVEYQAKGMTVETAAEKPAEPKEPEKTSE